MLVLDNHFFSSKATNILGGSTFQPFFLPKKDTSVLATQEYSAQKGKERKGRGMDAF